MTLKPASWNALMINIRSACKQRTFWIDLEVRHGGNLQSWNASREGGFPRPCINLKEMQASFDEFEREFPQNWTFQQQHDPDGNFDPVVFRRWQEQFHGSLLISLHVDGSWGEHQWLSAMFKDDENGKREAVLFKVSYC